MTPAVEARENTNGTNKTIIKPSDPGFADNLDRMITFVDEQIKLESLDGWGKASLSFTEKTEQVFLFQALESVLENLGYKVDRKVNGKRWVYTISW